MADETMFARLEVVTRRELTRQSAAFDDDTPIALLNETAIVRALLTELRTVGGEPLVALIDRMHAAVAEPDKQRAKAAVGKFIDAILAESKG